MCVVGTALTYFTRLTLTVLVVSVTEGREEGEKMEMGTHDKVIISVFLTRFFLLLK